MVSSRAIAADALRDGGVGRGASSRNSRPTGGYASKRISTSLQKLIDALKDELDSLGVRVTNLEDALDALDKRTKFAQSIQLHGSISTTTRSASVTASRKPSRTVRSTPSQRLPDLACEQQPARAGRCRKPDPVRRQAQPHVHDQREPDGLDPGSTSSTTTTAVSSRPRQSTRSSPTWW